MSFSSFLLDLFVITKLIQINLFFGTQGQQVPLKLSFTPETPCIHLTGALNVLFGGLDFLASLHLLTVQKVKFFGRFILFFEFFTRITNSPSNWARKWNLEYRFSVGPWMCFSTEMTFYNLVCFLIFLSLKLKNFFNGYRVPNMPTAHRIA